MNTENQNHYMEYCRINIEFEDLIIFNNNGTKKKNGRKYIPCQVNYVNNLAIFNYNYNRNIEFWTNNNLRINEEDKNLITKYIERSETRNELIRIQKQNEKSRRFEFYTDGSLIEPGTENCNMTSGFIQVGETAEFSQFATNIE